MQKLYLIKEGATTTECARAVEQQSKLLDLYLEMVNSCGGGNNDDSTD